MASSARFPSSIWSSMALSSWCLSRPSASMAGWRTLRMAWRRWRILSPSSPMFFTVLSFGIMIKTFPSSGSIYTYASKSLGSAIGFIAGWLMLLQYLISPDMVFIIAAEPLHQYVPAVPVWAWCLIFLAIVLVVASRGIQTTMIVNKIALVCECIVLGMFLVFGIAFIFSHPETSASRSMPSSIHRSSPCLRC